MKYVFGLGRTRQPKPYSTPRIRFATHFASLLMIVVMVGCISGIILTNESFRGWIWKSFITIKRCLCDKRKLFNRYEQSRIYYFGLPGTKFKNKLINSENGNSDGALVKNLY